MKTARPVFQDPLFSPERTVQRTLASGTVLRLVLEPLSGVRVLEYHRRAPGGVWGQLREEEGRVLSYAKPKLTQTFAEVLGQTEAS